MLNGAVVLCKSLIEEHSDSLMWGPDRGDIVSGYGEEAEQLLTESARDFIGRLDPAIQNKVAGKNAELLAATHGCAQEFSGLATCGKAKEPGKGPLPM